MIEMRDGNFTTPELFTDELLLRFKALAETGEARSLHVGSYDDLNRVKNQRDIENRVRELEAKIKELSPVASSIIQIPTEDDIKKLTPAP